MLISPAQFQAIVSGRQRGIGGALARAGLTLGEWPYRWAVGWRNRKFDAGRNVHKARVPVISVGNLTLGGTGKTPLVAWLARWFRQQGVRVTLISRGYGAEQGARNDEALELEHLLPDVPHVQNPDRVAAARMAIEEFEAQLLLLDDAFQHRRIARDLDIVLLDALEPFGFGHVFPRGLLREPIAGLKRAQIIVLTRADMVDDARRHQIRATAVAQNPQALWVEAAHAPIGLLAHGDSPDEPFRDLKTLRGQRVAAFCGLGNPQGFRHTLLSCGCELAGFREFPDHHAYSRDDLDSLAAWTASLDVTSLICTHKDLVKVACPRIGSKPLLALVVGMQFRSGGREFEQRLAAINQSIHAAQA